MGQIFPNRGEAQGLNIKRKAFEWAIEGRKEHKEKGKNLEDNNCLLYLGLSYTLSSDEKDSTTEG